MNITTNCHSDRSEPRTIYTFFSSRHHTCCRMTLHSRNTPQSSAALIDLKQVSDALNNKPSRLSKQILSKKEQAYFRRFTYLKRQREWLGGRSAAKIALLDLGPTRQPDNFQALSILPDPHGRPIPDTIPGIALSISHSDRFAVALAVRGAACGIDLQKISTKLPGLTNRFASSRELNILRSQITGEQELTRLTMLWSTKEALKKKILYDQPALFSGIQLQHISCLEHQIYRFSCSIHNHPEQSVTVHSLPPYVLALSGAEPHA